MNQWLRKRAFHQCREVIDVIEESSSSEGPSNIDDPRLKENRRWGWMWVGETGLGKDEALLFWVATQE